MEKPSRPHSSPRASSTSTTFVQTNANTFKGLVQRLTGPKDESLVQTNVAATPPALPKITGVRRPTFKLQQRRQGYRSKLTIVRPNSLLIPLMGLSSSSTSTLTSPSRNYLINPLGSPSTDFLGLLLNDKVSPTTTNLDLDEEAEEKGIKERGFYLHPSPRGSRPLNPEPELLSLFPLTSPSPKPTGC